MHHVPQNLERKLKDVIIMKDNESHGPMLIRNPELYRVDDVGLLPRSRKLESYGLLSVSLLQGTMRLSYSRCHATNRV